MIDSLLRIAGVYKAYEKYLNQQVKWGQMPEHIGIILDGNRRWATEKSLDATDGHWAGAKVGEQVLDWCLEYGIKTLTLYTFSTENFSRPSAEDTFDKYLYTAHLPNPNPDLVIRTSGEERLSGFLLWQSAYSELVFVDVYWPEFRRIDFLRAIRLYQMRHRRFGR